ncbi:hypothetical protein M0657_003229 [Pyricularia oryzae]|nr:hypothetical protein M9X92_005942 [Pyricularia oryzae]KAI7927407.1 hypothetical protein M0657_003229 [Pyricularia oryzae]
MIIPRVVDTYGDETGPYSVFLDFGNSQGIYQKAVRQIEAQHPERSRCCTPYDNLFQYYKRGIGK